MPESVYTAGCSWLGSSLSAKGGWDSITFPPTLGVLIETVKITSSIQEGHESFLPSWQVNVA